MSEENAWEAYCHSALNVLTLPERIQSDTLRMLSNGVNGPVVRTDLGLVILRDERDYGTPHFSCRKGRRPRTLEALLVHHVLLIGH